MFSYSSFNQPIGGWNVSKVTNMESMFESAKEFNQPIGNWDVKKVKNMKHMFKFAKKFNQDISNWNVTVKHKKDEIFIYSPIKEEYKPVKCRII